MGNFNEELVKAGVMLAGDALHPSSKGASQRVLSRQPASDKQLRASPLLIRQPRAGWSP